MFIFQIQLKLVSNISSPLRLLGLLELLLFIVVIINLLISIRSLVVLGVLLYSRVVVLDESY